ncbi:hypothetical protein LJC07_04770 [Christensenellaceae bacterium OttesenSCG-928-L17]|nr:hypothetical protein [Christensenellaceae bacterium OttesenSCG-928-L17]
MKLNYKASNIARAEREEGKKFFEVFGGLNKGVPSVDDLLFIFHAGGGSDDEFDAIFENGLEGVMTTIIEGLNDAGFLGKKVDMREVRKAMAEAKEQPVVSQSSGVKG